MVYDAKKVYLYGMCALKAVRESNNDIALIPAGLTSVVQPLAVSINKPFKDNAKKME